MEQQLPDFSEPHLAAAVERLPREAIDRLPFGAIRLDANGVVQLYSQTESELSGYGARPAIGRQFFTEIAPCMSTEAYQGRIDRALAAGRLDIEFNFIGDFADRERELCVRVQSARDGGYWIFMQRQP